MEATTQCPFSYFGTLTDTTTYDRVHQQAALLAHDTHQRDGGIEGLGGTAAPTEDTLTDLILHTSKLLGDVHTALDLAVERAREAGWSWQQVGDVMGTTRQAAWQRFGGKR